MPVNRFGVSVRKGARVTVHHPRGGQYSGVVTRVFKENGVTRVEIDNAYTAPIDDVAGSRKANPARPRTKRAYINRPSERTKATPTARLRKRRAKLVEKPAPGYFPNPRKRRKPIWAVGCDGKMVATFGSKKEALEYAQALADKTGKQCSVNKTGQYYRA